MRERRRAWRLRRLPRASRWTAGPPGWLPRSPAPRRWPSRYLLRRGDECSCLSPFLPLRFLIKVAVHQILGELDASELGELYVWLDATVNRHPYLPRLREDGGVLDRGLVVQRVGAAGADALDDVQVLAGEVAGAVEPRHAVEAGRVDDE